MSEQKSLKEKTFNILNLSVPVLIVIFIFFNPFPHTTAIKQICFYLSFLLTLILIYFKKIEFSFKSPFTTPFVLFVIWAFIGLFFALDKENSLHDFRAHLLNYMVFYYILINFINTRNRLTGLSWVIIISAFIFSIGEIYYFYFMQANSFSVKLQPGLKEIAVNHIGFITVPAILFSLHNINTAKEIYKKIIFIIFLLPVFALSILTQARITSVVMFLSVIILCFKNKKVMVICLGIILISIFISPLKNRFYAKLNPRVRFNINRVTFEIIKDFPITGIGFGMETYGNKKYIDLEAYSKKVSDRYRQEKIFVLPHSMVFSVAVRTGLIGFALFLYILYISFKTCWGCIKHGRDDFIKSWGLCITSVFITVIVIGFFEGWTRHSQKIVLYTAYAVMTILWKLNSVSENLEID